MFYLKTDFHHEAHEEHEVFYFLVVLSKNGIFTTKNTKVMKIIYILLIYLIFVTFVSFVVKFYFFPPSLKESDGAN